MSKAFELLQNVEIERGTGVGPVPVNRVRPSVIGQEEITRLIQRVFRVPDAPRSVVFAGIDPGDGCTSVCAATAENLASTAPGSVCVVDANLRNPSLHRYFEIANTSGLAEAVVQPGPVHNFAQNIAGTVEGFAVSLPPALSPPSVVPLAVKMLDAGAVPFSHVPEVCPLADPVAFDPVVGLIMNPPSEKKVMVATSKVPVPAVVSRLKKQGLGAVPGQLDAVTPKGLDAELVFTS